MEKLRELLNSYEEYKEKETGYSNYDWRLNEINDEEEHEQWITAFRVDDSQLGVEESIAVIICRGYCFIEWLVENDKIDLLRLDNRIALSEFNKVERVLMALSIQDNPIEYLVSILE